MFEILEREFDEISKVKESSSSREKRQAFKLHPQCFEPTGDPEYPEYFDKLTKNIRTPSDKEVVYDPDLYDRLFRKIILKEPVESKEECGALGQNYDNHITQDNSRKEDECCGNRTTTGGSKRNQKVLEVKQSSSKRELRKASNVSATNCHFNKHSKALLPDFKAPEHLTNVYNSNRNFESSSDEEDDYDFYGEFFSDHSTNVFKPKEPVDSKEKCGAPVGQYANNNQNTPDNFRNETGNVSVTNLHFYKDSITPTTDFKDPKHPTVSYMSNRNLQTCSDDEDVSDSEFDDELSPNHSLNDYKSKVTVKLEEKCSAPKDQYPNYNHNTQDTSRKEKKTDSTSTATRVSKQDLDEILKQSSSGRELRQVFNLSATNCHFNKPSETLIPDSKDPKQPTVSHMSNKNLQTCSDDEDDSDSEFYGELFHHHSTNGYKQVEPVKLNEKCSASYGQSNNNNSTPNNSRKEKKPDFNRRTNGVSNDSKHRIRVTFSDIRYNPFVSKDADKRLYWFLSNYGYIRGFSYNSGSKPEAIVDYQYMSAAKLAIDMESKYSNKFMKLNWENGPPTPSDDPEDNIDFSMYIPLYRCVHYFVERFQH